MCCYVYFFFFFKQKTAYEMRISDWSSDVCSSDLPSQIDTSKRENPSPNIEYRVGDLKDYLEQLSGYDLIYGRFVFGHNRDCIDLLGRIFANMRSGARLIFEEPDIGTARTLVGTGIIEEVEDLYLSVVRTFGTTRGVN